MFDIDTTKIASVGTVVGAAMETAGHFMQSAFIDLLEGGLATSVGSFLYLVSIISALTIVALGGKYKFGRWFLFGPILFYALVFPRVDSCGVVVRHGDRIYDSDQIWDKTKGLANVGRFGGDSLQVTVPEDGNLCAENPARVSAIFELWNNFVGATINSLVNLLRLDKRGADLDFVTKVDRFAALYTQGVTDPVVLDLLNSIVLSPCGSAYATMMNRMAPTLSDFEESGLDQKLEREMSSIVVNAAEHPRIIETIRKRGVGLIDPNKQTYTCGELWALGIDVLKNHSLELLSEIAEVDESYGDLEKRKALIVERLNDKFKLARDDKGEIVFAGGPEEGVVAIINEMATRHFIERIKQLNPAFAKGDFGVTQYRSLVGDVGGNQELADSIRAYSGKEEYRDKGRFLQAMLALPHVQGVLLYFLATLYPFFCIFAIVPGRHETVMMWFGLWFWVKSWDFGFAIVMLIDELLYTLMPHSKFISNEQLGAPVEAIKAALSVDPTYSVHIYYNIVATCLAAVPVLTAGLVKKGTGALTSEIGKAVRNFAGDPGGSFASYAGARRANTNLMKARRAQQNMLADAMYRQFKNKAVSGELLAATAMRAGVSIAQQDLPNLIQGLQQRALNEAATSNDPGIKKQAMAMAAQYGKAAGVVDNLVRNSAAGKMSLAFLEAKISQQERVAWADHAYLVALDVYQQSTQRHTDMLNAESRLVGYYDHSFRFNFPEAQYIQTVTERAHLNFAQPIGVGMTEAWKGVVGTKGQN